MRIGVAVRFFMHGHDFALRYHMLPERRLTPLDVVCKTSARPVAYYGIYYYHRSECMDGWTLCTSMTLLICAQVAAAHGAPVRMPKAYAKGMHEEYL